MKNFYLKPIQITHHPLCCRTSRSLTPTYSNSLIFQTMLTGGPLHWSKHTCLVPYMASRRRGAEYIPSPSSVHIYSIRSKCPAAVPEREMLVIPCSGEARERERLLPVPFHIEAWHLSENHASDIGRPDPDGSWKDKGHLPNSPQLILMHPH